MLPLLSHHLGSDQFPDLSSPLFPPSLLAPSPSLVMPSPGLSRPPALTCPSQPNHHGLRRHGPSQELVTIWFHVNLLSPGLCLATPTSFAVVSFFSGSLIVSFFVGLSCFCLCYFSEVLILKFTLFCCSWFLFSCV